MFYKVKEVQPLPNYELLVSFENGEKRKYDVKPLFDEWDEFATLSSVTGLFQLVKVETGGYAVSWNDEIDLSCNELYENGIAV